MRIPTLFRIWYSTTYSIVFFLLLLLLSVSPADTIYQSVKSRAYQKLFVVGGVYVLTIAIVLLIYSTRLYTNRSVLAAIPKPYVPIEDGEVGSLVRRMIVKALRRSAIIAWDSKPRDVRCEGTGGVHSGTEGGLDIMAVGGEREKEKEKGLYKKRLGVPATIIPVSHTNPPWGHISHPGWASPASSDLPNLQYSNVINELPNLIEAKAVSLAPPDPAVEGHAHTAQHTPLLPDAQIVNLLQRPRTMGLRDYLARLSSFGLLNPPSLGARFLSLYEHARFSTSPLSENEFRLIMDVFAEILNGMTTLDPSIIEAARNAQTTYDSDSRSLAPSTVSSSNSSTYTNLPYTTPMVDRASEFSFGSAGTPQTARTAPSFLPRNSVSGSNAAYRTPSERSLVISEQGSVRRKPVQRSPSTILPNSSSESSLGSEQGSVVRLRLNAADGESPYEYRFEDG